MNQTPTPTLQELQAMEPSERAKAFRAWCSTQTGEYSFQDHWRCPLARFGNAVMRTEAMAEPEPPAGSQWDGRSASQWPIGSANGFIPSLEYSYIGDLAMAPSHLEVVPHYLLSKHYTYEDLNRELARIE